ncbi:MAG: hypothetical protein A2044_05355 [Candidatus Firestonebacteria bacterium GWA2_43_8]|nr:MAG: hypothetical protein A2044_05355 [Candidatus Firestonebacteria bacterium GWA2_43_8]
MDIFNASDKEALLQVRIKSDEQSKKWTKAFKIPGKKSTTLDIPMSDLKTINLETMTYLGFAMGKNQYLTDMKPLSSDFVLYFDNMRLTK